MKAKPATGHFESPEHALAAGGLFGILLNERSRKDGVIKSCTPVLDDDGNYKPYMDIEMHMGGRFRVIIAEMP